MGMGEREGDGGKGGGGREGGREGMSDVTLTNLYQWLVVDSHMIVPGTN